MVRFICVVVLLAVAVLSAAQKPYYNVNDAPALFEKYIKDYNKVYKNEADRIEHYKAFVHTLGVINRSNAMNSATFDLNEFADYTPEEQKLLRGFAGK